MDIKNIVVVNIITSLL